MPVRVGACHLAALARAVPGIPAALAVPAARACGQAGRLLAVSCQRDVGVGMDTVAGVIAGAGRTDIRTQVSARDIRTHAIRTRRWQACGLVVRTLGRCPVRGRAVAGICPAIEEGAAVVTGTVHFPPNRLSDFRMGALRAILWA